MTWADRARLRVGALLRYGDRAAGAWPQRRRRSARAAVAALAMTAVLTPNATLSPAAAAPTADMPLPSGVFRLQLGSGRHGTDECLTVADYDLVFRKCGAYPAKQRWTSGGGDPSQLISVYERESGSLNYCVGSGFVTLPRDPTPTSWFDCDTEPARTHVWRWQPGEHEIHWLYPTNTGTSTGYLAAHLGSDHIAGLAPSVAGESRKFRNWTIVPVE
ncbi:hypothetical protein [Streptomyces eurocidicus]|nr:hypothetical protein [Streptomyces eurocidicus]MBB5117708.1 hypothetical protein [Streptomyces eurocidicus]MBF6053543.1 hypothetical protein [Streptomyces eurocidicus]